MNLFGNKLSSDGKVLLAYTVLLLSSLPALRLNYSSFSSSSESLVRHKPSFSAKYLLSKL
eukprot:706816-Hanusia_phi.AAC.6